MLPGSGRWLETEQQYGAGKWKQIRLLRLLKRRSLLALTRMVEQGLRFGALSHDSIAQFVIPPA